MRRFIPATEHSCEASNHRLEHSADNKKSIFWFKLRSIRKPLNGHGYLVEVQLRVFVWGSHRTLGLLAGGNYLEWD